MNLTEVRNVVPATLRDELDALWADYALTHEGAGVETFVAWLRDTSKIPEHVFREIHAAGRLDLGGDGTFADAHVPRGATMFPDDFGDAGEITAERTPEDVQRYKYLGKIGEGAMGEIHVALDGELRRKVAFKQMTKAASTGRGLAQRFTTEAQITAQLDHPNVVPVYNLERAPDGRLAYTMKLIRGRNLQEVLDQAAGFYAAGKLPPHDLALPARLDHFLKVCDAIFYAHAKGVVHRDLKPENIMVGPFGEVYVMDWGIARIMGAGGKETGEEGVLLSGDEPTNLTRMGSIIGTPAYMSPEQAEGRNEELDGRSDQFALGLILFELVSFKRAIVGKTAMALLLAVQQGALQPLEHVAGEPIPAALRAIIRKATQVNRDERYATVADLAEDIRCFVRGEPVMALPEGLIQKAGRWITHNLVFALTGVLVLLAMASAITIVVLVRSQRLQTFAEAREQRLSDLQGAVSLQGGRINANLVRIEGLLLSVETGVTDVLTQAQPGFAPPDFALGTQFAPPDLREAPRYGRQISETWPVLTVADGEPGDFFRSLNALALMRGQLRKVLLTSKDDAAPFWDPAKQDEAIAVQGTPITHVQIGLADGTHAAYPGHAGYPPGFDPRKRPWYSLGAESRVGPVWGNPYVDLSGLGRVLPCAAPVRDNDGNVLGVVAVDLTFDWIIQELLVIDQLEATTEAFLVDERGKVVVRTSEAARSLEDRAAASSRSMRLKSFPYEEAAAEFRQRPTGYLYDEDDAGERLILFSRLDQLGWTYVVVGKPADLLP